MGIFVDETFEGYAVGTFPGTWRSVFLGGSVQATGLGGSKGLQFNSGGRIQKDPLIDPSIGLQSDITIFHAFQGGAGSTIVSLHNADPTNLSTDNTICEIIIEPDSTITAQTPGAIIGNTQFPVSWKDWHFLQANINISDQIVAGVDFLKVTVSLWLQGKLVLNSGVGISTLTIPSLVAGIGANIFQFGDSSGRGSTVDNITIQTPSVAANVYPHPGSPFAKFSQLVAEILEHLPNPSMARVSQLANEVLELPSTERVRCSQLVIELITDQSGQIIPTSGTGWMVYEA